MFGRSGIEHGFNGNEDSAKPNRFYAAKTVHDLETSAVRFRREQALSFTAVHEIKANGCYFIQKDIN